MGRGWWVRSLTRGVGRKSVGWDGQRSRGSKVIGWVRESPSQMGVGLWEKL